MIDNWVDIGASVASAIVAIYLSRMLVIRRKQYQGQQLETAMIYEPWLFTMFLTAYFVLRIEVLANWLDAQVAGNNLSRFIAYIFVCWAAYFLNRIISRSMGLNLPMHQSTYPVAMSFILSVLFIAHISSSPNSETSQPTTLEDLLFRSLLYVYIVALLGWSLPGYFKVFLEEEAFVARLQLLFTILSLGSTVGLAVIKLMEGLVAFWAADSSFLYWFETIAPILKALIVLPFVLAYLPKRVLLDLGQPYFYLQGLLTLRDIKLVEKKVHKYCTPVSPESPTLWQMMTNTDYFIHRSLIHIMDGHKNLAGYLSPPPGMPEILPGEDSLLQDYSFSEVNEFFQKLASIDVSLPYDKLIRRYQKLGQQIRQEERWAAFPAIMRPLQHQGG